MHLKSIIIFLDDCKAERVTEAARKASATYRHNHHFQRTWRKNEQSRDFSGAVSGNSVDIIVPLIEEHLSRTIMETIAEIGQFDATAGTGIAFQIDVEDAVG